MKTFISYHSRTRRLAGRIKEYLDRYGFEGFLAHHDIAPQSKWVREIEANLSTCDLFLPLLTEEFEISSFCQQETGFAYCRKVDILPVLISRAPVGFIASTQGIRFSEQHFDDSCWKIVKHVAKKEQFTDHVIDKIIDVFGERRSYDDAGKQAAKILTEFDFTGAQVEKIMQYVAENDQIYNSKTARPVIFEFMANYEEELDPDLVEEYRRRWRGKRW